MNKTYVCATYQKSSNAVPEDLPSLTLVFHELNFGTIK